MHEFDFLIVRAGAAGCVLARRLSEDPTVSGLLRSADRGCSIIVKGPEDTPISSAAPIDCFHAAGVPRGVLNLVYGVPAEI